MEKKMKSIIAILALSVSLQGCMLMMPGMHGMMNHGGATEDTKPASDTKATPSGETSKPAESAPHQH